MPIMVSLYVHMVLYLLSYIYVVNGKPHIRLVQFANVGKNL